MAGCERSLDRGEPGIVCGRCWARAGLAAPTCRAMRPSRRTASRAAGARCCRRTCARRAASRGPPARRRLGVVHALKYGGWHRVAGGWPRAWRACAWPTRRARRARRARARSARRRAASASAATTRASVSRRALAARVEDSRLDRRARAQSAHGDADAVDTGGAVPQRFRRVPRAPASARESLRGAHVVLVDDVVTTAATLNACAAALYDGGARIISYVTFGRAPAMGDRW